MCICLFKKNYLFIYGCAGASLLLKLFFSCGERGLHLVAMCRLLIAKVCLVEQGLWGTQASVAQHVDPVAAAPGL